ncbi:hypothetical protein IAR55_007022 [Kwoniella newhampshirensis]|uniref:SAP domain-containing protein n=1 Tax=Kwoniella newhampshirensis TaxID=1651941 RepID=A0AAW0YSS0_9TREE
MSDEILRNSAALNALKRHQLVSLSKRYELRASGKNVEMVERLQDYAISHAHDLDFYIPEPASTPGPSVLFSPTLSEPDSPLPQHPILKSQTRAPTPLHHRLSQASIVSRPSEAWEVLSDSGASMISPKKTTQYERGIINSASVSSWKSANNGEALAEFGGSHSERPRSNSSMRALATSLTRRGSRILLGRSVSASSHLSLDAEPPVAHSSQEEVEAVEEIADAIPPSPASTVGVPKRHSTISLLERPSTIRLCSPAPTSPNSASVKDEADELPFFGQAKNLHSLNERRSMAPLRPRTGSATALSSINVLSRKSMPALINSTSASLSSIYPPLPIIPSEFSKPTPIPGSFPPLPPTPSASRVIFGSGADSGVSNRQFSEAAQAILKEMNAKLPEGSVKFGEEYLKGKKAEIDKLVHVNKELGTGGWGLGAGSASTRDRYAEAHQKEFAKMSSISKSSTLESSIPRQTSFTTSDQPNQVVPKRKHVLTHSKSSARLPSAPNGLPLTASEDDKAIDRDIKRARLSNGPHYLGTLRDAGKSLAHILGEEMGTSGDTALRMMKERRAKRRSSLAGNKGRKLTSRFGFLRKRNNATATSGNLEASTSSVTSPPNSIPAPTMPRKTSVYAPRDPPQPRKKFDLDASLAQRPTRRNSTYLANVIKRNPEIFETVENPAQVTESQKDRGRSTSANTMLSYGSNASRRPKIPDFAPPGGHNPTSGSTNTLGLPKSQSMSSSFGLSMKKQSQADLIHNARPAPPPPTATIVGSALTRPAAINRSSTLHLPTASSLARMQATVKPTPERPLPVIPSNASASGTSQIPRLGSTVQPFGNASSRSNYLFESNFHLNKPSLPSPAMKRQLGGASRTPMKGKGAASFSTARVRAKTSGLSAVKSRGNLKEEMEIKRKRSEIKARQERIGEERELREMLRG